MGRLLAEELLKRGHRVTAFVHHNTQALSESPNLHVAVGDVHDQNDIKKAVQDAEVVVSTLGSWGTPTKDIVSSATAHLLPLLDGKRFVGVTGAGARLPGEKFSPAGWINRLFLMCIARAVLRDADKHLRLLSTSSSSWTVLRSPVMTNSRRSTYNLSDNSPMPWRTIPRRAVVHALADLAEHSATPRKAPFIA